MEKFDIHKEPERFVKVLAGYTLMSDAELGLNTFIKRDGNGKCSRFNRRRVCCRLMFLRFLYIKISSMLIHRDKRHSLLNDTSLPPPQRRLSLDSTPRYLPKPAVPSF